MQVSHKMYRVTQFCTDLHTSVQTSVQGLKPLGLLALRVSLHRCTVVLGILFSGGLSFDRLYRNVVCYLCTALPYLVQSLVRRAFQGCTGTCTDVCFDLTPFSLLFNVIFPQSCRIRHYYQLANEVKKSGYVLYRNLNQEGSLYEVQKAHWVK